MTIKEEALKKYGDLSLSGYFTFERILEEVAGNKNVAGKMRAVVAPNNGSIKPFSLCSQCRGIITVRNIVTYLEEGNKLEDIPGIGKKTATVYIKILDSHHLL